MTADRLRVRVIQVGYGDAEPVAERVQRVADLVRAQRGADLVVLPELWAHGGFAYPSWADRSEALDGPVAQALSAAAREIGATVHAGSIIEQQAGGSPGSASPPGGRTRWNTSLLFDRGGHLASRYRKIHRFGFGEGEPALLDAGSEVVTAALTAPGGRPVATAGMATCYDLRFPELFRRLVDAGSEVFLVPAAWPAARVAHWTLLGRARAVENQCFTIQCNTAGTHSGVAMGGRSQIVGPTGVVLAEAGEDEEVISAELDLGEVAACRTSFPVLTDRRL
jgi:predicted amidohydrolase